MRERGRLALVRYLGALTTGGTSPMDCAAWRKKRGLCALVFGLVLAAAATGKEPLPIVNTTPGEFASSGVVMSPTPVGEGQYLNLSGQGIGNFVSVGTTGFNGININSFVGANR